MQSVTLYSTGCPMCRVLKAKLDAKHVPYEENHSLEDMMELGISSVPILSVDGELLTFSQANSWVNDL